MKKREDARIGASWRWCAATVCALWLAATMSVAEDLLPVGATKLIGYVNWTANGQSGRSLFQGLARGIALEGHLYAGDDQLVVTGVVGSDDSLHGTVAAPDGTPVGSFDGTRDGETLRGTYTVFSTASPEASSSVPASSPESTAASENTSAASQTWEAPAADVPTPQGGTSN